ncbi:MAG: hypothetical protein NVSMB51_08000 [Solirubrobacteraceae bacterium]
MGSSGTITLRAARPGDVGASILLFASAASEFASLAGSRALALEILAELWGEVGHWASFEFADLAVADKDDSLAGMIVAFGARARLRLNTALLMRAWPHLPPGRRARLPGALARIALATPPPARGSLYIAAIGVAPQFRCQGVASLLVEHVVIRARREGYRSVTAATGANHHVVRDALEHRDFRLASLRRGGYATYERRLGEPRGAEVTS